MANTWIQQSFAMDSTDVMHTQELKNDQSSNVHVVSLVFKNLHQILEILYFLNSDLGSSASRPRNPNPKRMNVPTVPPCLFRFEISEHNVTVVYVTDMSSWAAH